ncbi:UDP-N-acetylmuramate--L-alanine ligase [Rhabdothermincola salaria]|uniref:UDP-N-acetylmuramate--L-alanine ligase n=1 Tax=Rhabdothermincola salaria TaxID=2903142 RepID=UPI001E394BF5|nr:UDP-N-acetylmuramate--L-alanine ligase [Rhabdothermincola salaria]
MSTEPESTEEAPATSAAAAIAEAAGRIDLSGTRVVHVVGVGGAGMSAIAEVLAAMGHRVSGSDLKESPGLERLRALGIDVTIGHAGDNVPDDADFVAVSTAIPARNTEVRAAEARGVPVVRRAELLAAVAATRRALAVAGTHGKTTTSSMLALVLVEAGERPSFIIGGDVNEIGSGAAWDSGEWFVIEADESDGSGFALPRHGCIVTNVEPDHLEFHGSVEALHAAFASFLAATPGPRVVCADDPVASALGRAHDAVTYGTAADADYRLVDLQSGRGGVRFDLHRRGQLLGEVVLPVPGAHNARNAAAAVTLALELGVDFAPAAAALARFAGVARRFQFRGEAAGVTFVDDYAHLPTEVGAALGAALDGGWSRVVVVFQPHRYSRTEALWPEFADAFEGADAVVITDVYASGEMPRPGISGKLVVDAVLDAHPHRQVAYLPRRRDVVDYLTTRLRPGDLCLTLGAGDLTAAPDEVLDRLALADQPAS